MSEQTERALEEFVRAAHSERRSAVTEVPTTKRVLLRQTVRRIEPDNNDRGGAPAMALLIAVTAFAVAWEVLR
jgi:hypothetical protein